MLGGILADEQRDYVAATAVLEGGWRSYPLNPRIANNLAYVYLLSGRATEAREVLESVGGPENGDVSWRATWGLLRLWEDSLDQGRALYDHAAREAVNAGNKRLSDTVRQKMYLEIARAHMRRGEMPEAASAIDKGLAVRGGRQAYRSDLSELQSRVSSATRNDPSLTTKDPKRE